MVPADPCVLNLQLQLPESANLVPQPGFYAGFTTSLPQWLCSLDRQANVPAVTHAPKRKRKRVRFNKRMARTKHFRVHKQVAQRWLSEEALSDIYKRNKSISALHRRSSFEYIHSVSYLMQSCNNFGQARPQDVQQHVARVLQTNVRGLERRIVPSVTQCRKHVKSAVLFMQRQLKQQGLYGTPIGDILLREKSLARSQPSRQLAFQLAQADEVEARLVQTQSFLKTRQHKLLESMNLYGSTAIVLVFV